MKTALLVVAITAVGFTGCSSDTIPTGSPYPTYPSPSGRRDEPVVVTQDGTVIDRNGRAIGNVGNMPPGQAKKLYGAKSAKAFAPGQRKKARRETYYENDDHSWGNGKGKGKKH